ncbi:ABC transporter ATP-binding protein [Bradyrhizobium sp. SSUT18]|uniref:ABC transporter ATP-binding protein n=1 Tax=Bradyrhizobium sp. SSUT18 TaxID=3040602 RepID=UPI00244A5BF8|nr:ABC transporter ATP-binding protein [Bradyrhizobium sp. SSUT18]MDH2399910.1 ABC transporter ATP-binding protein [Bradyrhizobium sp. SSUT18]
MTTSSYLLEVANLDIALRRGRTLLPAVADLSFAIARGETLAIVGESGCGKSISMLSLLGLLPKRDWEVRGKALFDGSDLIALADKELRRIRGNRIGFIFQDAMAAFNPVLPIGLQIAEVLTSHSSVSFAAAEKRAVELLALTHVPDPHRRVHDYPHQLSGGLRQRAMIAMALACDPLLLIADEPTTALDVTIQAQILDLLLEIQRERQMALILITHDLGVVANMADRVLVMYAGREVEEQPVDTLITAPAHPYTRGLLAARPRLGREGDRQSRLAAIQGAVPALGAWPDGCAFAPRCPSVEARCRVSRPLAIHFEPLTLSCHVVADERRGASHKDVSGATEVAYESN